MKKGKASFRMPTARGLKHDGALYCDQLVSLEKAKLTNFISALSHDKMEEVNAALRIALAVE